MATYSEGWREPRQRSWDEWRREPRQHSWDEWRLAPNQAIAQNLPPALAESIPNLPGVSESEKEGEKEGDKEGEEAGKTVAVVCSGFTCQPPVSDPQELERLLKQHLTSKCG